MVGFANQLMKKKTEWDQWVITLLHSKFFGSCDNHSDLRKHEKNVFCIDCNLCFCKHCISSSTHELHRWLQICKYVYQDVVRLQDIQKFLDCSKIQTYKINGEKAVHLNPRPQTKDPKTSTSKSGVPCEGCGRHIHDVPNRFCSIACKVSVVPEISNDNNHLVISKPIPEFNDMSLKEKYDSEVNISEKDVSTLTLKESSQSLSESSEECQAWMSSTLKPNKQLHKRKGVPHRAPLR